MDDTFQKVSIIDKISYKSIFSNYYSGLVKYATRLLKDKIVAEDIVQELFIEIWVKRDKLSINTSLKSYLYTSIKNDCLDYLKSKIKRTITEPLSENLLIDGSDNSNIMDVENIKLYIQKAQEKLPEKCSIIFHLSKNCGLSHKEISDKLNISKRTVEKQVSIALKKIREYINDVKK